jgi:hypothetical protein
MNVSRKVLDSTAMYIQYREAEARTAMFRDTLNVGVKHMSEDEYQAYAHITGMYDIANRVGSSSPAVVHAESAPMQALTPEALAEYEAEATRVQLSR